MGSKETKPVPKGRIVPMYLTDEGDVTLFISTRWES